MIKIKKLFSIGEVAKIKDITIKTLRYYHKVGILIPSYIDESTGYRYYSIDQFIYIDIIKGCRALGSSIVELQEVFKEYDTDKLMEFLKMKKLEAEANINKMKVIIKNIDNLNISVDYSKNLLKNNEISVKYFNRRYIIIAPCKKIGDLEELIYYSNLDKIIKDNSSSVNMERGIIYNLNSDGTLAPQYVYNGLLDSDKLSNKDNIMILPEGKYLTLSYNNHNEESCKNKILDYIKNNNIKASILIETELYNDFFNTKSYSCEIQILL